MSITASSFLRLASTVLLLATAGCAEYGLPRSQGEKVYANVPFAAPGGTPLRMDLYVPRANQPVPVVVWIFGGSWKIGSKAYHVNLRDLTRSGIAVAAIEYRLDGTAKYPAQIEDCQTAVEWLRAHGRAYGIDGTRLGVSGESAGGHLAALLGTLEGTPRIRAVCALYPPTDLLGLGRHYAQPGKLGGVEQLLGGPIEQKRRLAIAASPVNHIGPNTPPFYLIHGSADQLVPLSQSELLDQRLRAAHIESHLVIVAGQPHWFLLTPPQVDAVARFFQAHL